MVKTNKSSEFLELLEKSKRGRLKVYIGSVAGVGKTYRMLQEAKQLQEKGVDVVLGFIETHNREETHALIEGLEIIPRQQIKYKDVTIEEMDLEAIFKRRPEVVIVDELAHSNLPVCKNDKRYKDVNELLDAGINVICAFNVQHLESINDIVQGITDVKIHERIPDTFLEKADQVVNIDLSAEDLIDRLQAGKIYKKEKIDQALQNFFKLDSLSKLRELALREVAERLDKPNLIVNQRDSKDSDPSRDRIMVCLNPESFSQKYLLRKSSKLAGKLNTDWFVVYVETQKDQPEVIDNQTQRHLYSDIQLAQELGATFVHLKDQSRFDGIVNFAEKERIKHIILLGTKISLFNLIFNNSLVKKLLNLERYDIHLINPFNKGTKEDE